MPRAGSWWRSAGGDYHGNRLIPHIQQGWMEEQLGSRFQVDVGTRQLFPLYPSSHQRFDIATTSADGKQIEEGYNNPYGVMCCPYQNANGKWVIVAINYSEDVKPVNFQLDNHEQKNWQMYRTSDISSESLAPIGRLCNGTTQLAPRSMDFYAKMIEIVPFLTKNPLFIERFLSFIKEIFRYLCKCFIKNTKK